MRRLKRISRRTGQEVGRQCNLITCRPHRPALPTLNNKNVSAPTNEATRTNIATHKGSLMDSVSEKNINPYILSTHSPNVLMSSIVKSIIFTFKSFADVIGSSELR